MPPTKGEIWDHYTETRDAAGKLIEAKCKYCKKAKYSTPSATRLTAHIIKCKDCLPTIREHFAEKPKRQGQGTSTATAVVNLDQDQEEYEEDNPSTSFSSTSNSRRAPDNISQTVAVPAKRQRSMISCLDVVTKEEKSKLDALFCRAMLSKGLSFNVFEGEHMQIAFKTLRPAYQLPSRKSFAGPLLNQEYESVMQSVNKEISKARALTVESDGWNNNRHEGIVNFVVCTPQPYFYKSVEPGTERENAEFLSQHFIDVINAVNSDKVLLLVTDNASAMKRAWSLVQQVHPHIYAIGCGSHGLNLLFKDIVKLPVFKDLINKATSIVKIRKRRQLNAIFKSKQKQLYGNKSVSLVLPPSTRFAGAYFLLVSLQKNKLALGETVLTDSAYVPPEVRRNVLDNEDHGFWAVLSFFVNFIQPVVEGTHLIEADDSRLSHMVKICMKIKSLVNEALNEDSVIPLGAVEQLKTSINHRISKFCVSDMHLATYLVDPFFVGEGLTDRDCHGAMEVIEGLAQHLKLDVDSVIENLAEFKTKTNFYSNAKMWKHSNTMNATTWWDFFCANQPLHPIAVRLLSLIPSACPCERIWSEYGYVHNKVRNKLSNKKVEKEVAVKHNLNLCQGLTEEARKKKNELSAEREKKIRAYPCVSLFDNHDDSEDDDWMEQDGGGSDLEEGPLWTSDEELQESDEEDNNSSAEDEQEQDL